MVFDDGEAKRMESSTGTKKWYIEVGREDDPTATIGHAVSGIHNAKLVCNTKIPAQTES